MGRRGTKIDHVNDQYYRKHLYGEHDRFNSNQNMQREAMIERMYVRILTELSANRFKWPGMPESIDIRFLELTLFWNALSVFYYDHDYGRYFALRGNGNGLPNMHDNPTSFNVVGNTFVHGKTISAKKCVPIWANYLRVPDLDIVMIYANKLANIDRTIEISSKNARRTKVIASTENTRLSADNINRAIENGDPFIRVTETAMDEVSLTAIDLGIVPDSIEKLSIVRARLWNECMGLLGINNANQDKKERLVASEVDANNEQVGASRAVNLNARKFAAHKINLMFGLNVEVEFNDDIQGELDGTLPDNPVPPEGYMNNEIEAPK